MRIMIVDDEQPARERIKQILDSLEDYSVVAEADCGERALSAMVQCDPDVVLLDIRMPGMDGLETARNIALLDEPPAVIFTTAYEDHALEAFGAQAVGYLLKPVRKQRLQDALQSASRVTRAQLNQVSAPHSRESERSHLCARVRGGLELIPLDEVIYFKADQKYVTVRYVNGEVLLEESLKQLESEFGDRFVRIHRNALVAKDYIAGLQRRGAAGCDLSLRGCDELVAVSRRHLPGIRRLLKQQAG
ncbi:MAG: LytTR family DNA-binding domain-containing protein [Pseudomonadota bacterium]|nr:LytTR family DNA-binding domain-containing protein [Pseudomonadota bacterium]